MIEMTRRFLRQRFGSPAMAIALGVFALLTAVQGALSEPERAMGAGFFAILLISAGSVSKDASSGALQMILARPIRRTAYLFGRFAGMLAAYAVFLVATGVLTAAVGSTLPRLLGATAAPVFSVAPLARGAAASFLDAVLFASMLLLFSTFLRGYADVLAYIVFSIMLSLLPGLGEAFHQPWLRQAGDAIRKNALPQVGWSDVLRGRDILGEPTGRWVLAVTVYLALAALIFSRRQFAYGQD